MNNFLMNVWQMAGWSHELQVNLIARRLCGVNVLLYRTSDGRAVALRDRCPHRFAPLSKGTREGDVIICGYHGLGFDSSGRCVHNPFSDKVPTGALVQAFPVAERQGIVWIWLGESEKADEATIVQFDFLERNLPNHLLRGYTRMEANYEYGTDNLMDLSHIEFVHKGSFAGAGVIFAGKHEIVQNGETLHSNWWMPDVAAPGHTFGIYPRDMRTDHWLDMRWNAPATMYLNIGATPLKGDRADGVIVEQAHILTPESDGVTHYFWATSSALPLDDPETAAGLKALFAKAFDEEDKPMIEAAYANIESADFWKEKPVFLGVDAGGVRARRLLETMRRGNVQTTA